MDAIRSFSGRWRFLSNFYPALVEFEGLLYPTAEHAFQAAKSFDPAIRQRILELATPGDAKRAGRRVKIRPDWEGVKVRVMEQILLDKFTRDSQLRQELLHTGDVLLEEGNTWGDRTWGTVDGVGDNLLGKALMKIRTELQANRGE
jgi:ribA/ribD-fused uncharacterized protein